MVLQILALIYATICVVSGAICPKPEEVAPCECFTGTTTISLHCIGKKVTDETIKLLTRSLTQTSTEETKPFDTLEVYDTSIKALPENSFGSAKFVTIFVKSNHNLEKIDPNAFKASAKVAISLDVQKNPKLTGNELFEMVRSLEMVAKVRLDYNNITQIPAHAFTPNNSSKGHIETLYLTNNHIKSIGQNAFYGQPLLKVASIKHNQIERLDENALTLSKHESLFKTSSVYLDHNLLTEKSFANSSLANPEHDDISLHMENNLLTSLPQDLFKPFITSSSKSRLYLLNNKFNCDCSMKWVHDLTKSTEKRINEVFCSNHSNKNIISLTDTDLGKCSFD